MREVYSSHVDAIGYDDETGELHVRFRNGKPVVYEGVPADVALSVSRAPSIGSALRSEVRGKYKHRYA